MQKWMYKVVEFEPSQTGWCPIEVDGMITREGDEHHNLPMPGYLNLLGEQGWELTAATLEHYESKPPYVWHLIFKRPKD